MKKLLLITGDLACGKTTFAKLLSKRYDTNLYFKDSLKELLGDTVGFTDRASNLKLSKAAVQVMVHIFSEFAAMGKNLILEANFRSHELERLQQALLEEEESSSAQDDTPLELETDIADTEYYRNYAGTVRVYNTDRTDVDLEEYSREVYKARRPGLTILVCLLILLTGVLAVLVLWLLGRTGGWL